MRVRPRCFPKLFESGLELAGAHVRESEPNEGVASNRRCCAATHGRRSSKVCICFIN
jgi:hypothetical protein